MSEILMLSSRPRDAHWTYDDPSGVPDLPLEVPADMRGGIEVAAAREGVSATEWLRRLVAHGLALPAPKAVCDVADYRFDTPQPVDLEVKVPIGDIDVETVDGDESVVTVEGSERLVERTVVALRGRTLVVELEGKKSLGISISIGDFSFGNNHLKITARIPHGSAALFNTASGDVDVRGRISQLDTKTASGDLEVVGEIERHAVVKTVSGDVRLERVGGELRVQSVSGDVEAEKVGGSVVAKSVSGELIFRSVRAGRVDVTSVSGDILIGVAAGTSVDVDAGSVSGGLASEAALGSDPGAGTGDGPSLVICGKTVSGDFKVVRAS